MKNRLIVLTRYPEPGKVKSRLIPALGAEGAAALHREMAAHTLAWAAGLRDTEVEILFQGGDERLMKQSFPTSLPVRPQTGGDLGRRMADAFAMAFAGGARKVLLIGTDCPDLDARLVYGAFRRLTACDMVLGPAIDGGYYLIALRRNVPELFEGIAWGTGKVLSQTIHKAGQCGLSVAQLRPLADVDRPEDVPIWQHVKRSRDGGSRAAPRISIIIPTLNESPNLGKTLSTISNDAVALAGVEVIVVDGGSSDDSIEIAEAHNTRVLKTPRGRARQMNAGAAVATGEILLFLHADTRLPEGFPELVRQSLARPGTIAGAFRLRVEGAGGSLRLIQRAANLRSRFLHMPYGDQAIYVCREVFHSLGGFPQLPIMEDYEFMRRLRRRGRIALTNAEVVTSARRWQAMGTWRTTWINQMVLLGYRLGLAPDRLVRWYTGKRT